MHNKVRRIVPLVFLLIVVVGGVYYFTALAQSENGPLQASGTIEATQVQIASEVGGLVTEVLVEEGEYVEAGQTLVQFDDALLQAQLQQAEDGLNQAQAAYEQATSAADLERISVQQSLDALYDNEEVARAQAWLAVVNARSAVSDAEDRVDNLPSSASDADVEAAQARLDLAQALLDKAEADYEKLKDGPDPDALELLNAKLAGLDTGLEVARAQVTSAESAVATLQVQLDKTIVTAPVSGTVMVRSVEQGEMLPPGAPLLTLGKLDELTIAVFLPEDRYGVISLGDEATVEVDSFPGQAFTAKVIRIAEQAEFTPRNVQTQEGRKTTVFEVKLSVDNQGGKLKPGMPADVNFGK